MDKLLCEAMKREWAFYAPSSGPQETLHGVYQQRLLRVVSSTTLFGKCFIIRNLFTFSHLLEHTLTLHPAKLG